MSKKPALFRTVYFFVFIVLSGAGLVAHPHIVVDYSVELEEGADGSLEGFRVTWLFDPLFSQEVIFEVDRNRDQILQPPEVEMVYSFAFQNTQYYNYFTRFQIDSEEVIVSTKATDFHARIEGRRLAYEYTIAFDENQARWTENSKKLGIWIFDETFFSAFLPAELPIKGNSFGFQSRFFRDETRVITYDAGDLGTATARTNPDKIEFIRP